MAIEYYIDLDYPANPSDLARWIASNMKMEYLKEEHNGEIVDRLIDDGIVCSTGWKSQLGQEIDKEEFDIDSKIYAVCRINKFDLYDVGMEKYISVVILCLSELSCDLLLQYHESSDAIILRKNGKIYFANNEGDHWNEYWKTHLDAACLEYTIKDLPSAP